MFIRMTMRTFRIITAPAPGSPPAACVGRGPGRCNAHLQRLAGDGIAVAGVIRRVPHSVILLYRKSLRSITNRFELGHKLIVRFDGSLDRNVVRLVEPDRLQ